MPCITPRRLRRRIAVLRGSDISRGPSPIHGSDGCVFDVFCLGRREKRSVSTFLRDSVRREFKEFPTWCRPPSERACTHWDIALCSRILTDFDKLMMALSEKSLHRSEQFNRPKLKSPFGLEVRTKPIIEVKVKLPNKTVNKNGTTMLVYKCSIHIGFRIGGSERQRCSEGGAAYAAFCALTALPHATQPIERILFQVHR